MSESITTPSIETGLPYTPHQLPIRTTCPTRSTVHTTKAQRSSLYLVIVVGVENRHTSSYLISCTAHPRPPSAHLCLHSATFVILPYCAWEHSQCCALYQFTTFSSQDWSWQSFSQPKLSRCSLFNFRWHGIEFWFEGSWIKASRLSPKNPSVSQTPYLPQPPDRFHTFQRPSSRISIAIQIEFKLLKNEIILNFHLLDWGNYRDTMLCQRQVITFTSKSRQYKNWPGKIVTILFYTNRPNSLIPSPFLSNISLLFRLADNFKGCSDARLSKLFHIQRNGQCVQ